MGVSEMDRLRGHEPKESEDTKEQKDIDCEYALYSCLYNAEMLIDIGTQFVDQAHFAIKEYDDAPVCELLQILDLLKRTSECVNCAQVSLRGIVEPDEASAG